MLRNWERIANACRASPSPLRATWRRVNQMDPAVLRHAIEAGRPRRGTRLGAQHESAATPKAAGAKILP